MDMASMTGEKIYGKKFTVSEVTFDGNKGHFMFRDKDAQKDKTTGEWPPKEDLGENISVVVLKIRRKLSVFKKKPGTSLYTNEHNHKGEMVALFGLPETVKGVADQIRKDYAELRTQQMVYAYLPVKQEVVRVVVKGASLGSNVETPGVNKFYDYLKSFGTEDHVHEFFTELSPVKEKGDLGDYYAINFQRGAKLDEQKQEKVNGLIQETHFAIEDSDRDFRERLAINPQDAARAAVDDEELPVAAQWDDEEQPLAKEFETGPEVAYPDDEINPDDIPF